MHSTKVLQYRPLQFVDGTILIDSRFLKKIYEGYGFSVAHRWEGVSSSGSFEVFFENPNDSGMTVFVLLLEAISTGQAWIDVYRNNAVTASGTAMGISNVNFGSANESVVNLEYDGTYTIGDLVHSTVVPGGSLVRAVGGSTEFGESVVIPEGGNFIVKVTNKSASSEDMSLRLLWWEESL